VSRAGGGYRPRFAGPDDAAVADQVLDAYRDAVGAERATLTAGRFGAGEYTLRVPDATVAITAVEGRPLLVYRLEIDERGYTRSTTHFLSTESVGSYAASMSDDTFPPDTVNRTSYEGRLQVVVRANDTSRVVAERSTTVEVIE